MAQVGIACIAQGFHPYHAEGRVFPVFDGIFLYRLGKAGPSGARVKFDAGIKQGRITAGTSVNPRLVGGA